MEGLVILVQIVVGGTIRGELEVPFQLRATALIGFEQEKAARLAGGSADSVEVFADDRDFHRAHLGFVPGRSGGCAQKIVQEFRVGSWGRAQRILARYRIHYTLYGASYQSRSTAMSFAGR